MSNQMNNQINKKIFVLIHKLEQLVSRQAEVKAQIIGEAIRLDGEIGNIRKWEYLTKVLKNYAGSTRNFVVF